MTTKNWLNNSQSQLKDMGVETARLDCLVLLEDETGKDRSWILAHPEFELQIEQIGILNTKVAQRAKHIPLAYIRGKTEFYGRELVVNEHVLEPRPESEAIIELLKSLTLAEEVTIADIGTGSGALAITAKLELPTSTVIAIDIDVDCLKVARQNSNRLNAPLEFFEGNLLTPIQSAKLEQNDLTLLCNLPYVPDEFHINRAATHEPKLALFGGPDGLDLYRTMFEQTKTMAIKPQYILSESLPTQHKALADIAKAAGYSLEKTDDFIQLFTKY